jgi:rfaE bifunctional protein nucleotidyltransferase chain/domain
MNKLDIVRKKIISRSDIGREIARWRFLGKKIVFTNGCFDVLHMGHVDYLSRAADLGNVLIIGMNSDGSVRRLKGSGRPLNPEDARALLLASLHFVDAVVVFGEDTPIGLIREIRPDVLVKGADYRVEEIAGHELVLARGGSVITLELLPGYSTSALIRKIGEGAS